MAGREGQRRREAHTLLVARLSRSETQREILNILTAAIEQVGAKEAAALTVGYLQAQLGMTKPLAEVRTELRHKHVVSHICAIPGGPCSVCGDEG